MRVLHVQPCLGTNPWKEEFSIRPIHLPAVVSIKLQSQVSTKRPLLTSFVYLRCRVVCTILKLHCIAGSSSHVREIGAPS